MSKKIDVQRPVIDREGIKNSVNKMKRAMKRKTSAPSGHEAPDFWALLDDPDIGDPFAEFQIGDSVEETANAEVEVMGEALKRIIAEKKDRRQKYQMLTDANYFVTVVFQSTEQKLDFMRKAGWGSLNDNFEWVMVNGLELADMMGIELETIYIPKKDPPQAPVALRNPKIIIGGETE